MPTLHAQEANGEALFSFVVVGCPHISENKKGQPTGIEKFEILLKRIDSLQEKPDFMLIAGDIHIRGFKKVYPKIKMPVYVSFGNHESMGARKEFRKIFPELFKKADFYSFKHKNCLFIQICDAIPGDHVGSLSSEFIFPEWGEVRQCEWLEKQLADNYNSVAHTFIFGHIPPHPQGKDRNMYLSPNDQKFLKGLIQKYKPTALFFAHLHSRLEFKIGDSEVVVVGSSNWHFDKNSPTGFMKVKVFADRIEKEFIPLGIYPHRGKASLDSASASFTPMLPKGSPGWKYNINYPKTEPSKDAQGKAWYQLDYDDTSWQKGKAPLGYGDEPRATYGTKLSKNRGSYYFRKSFKIKDLPSTNNLILRVASDNAAIVYLNGKLVDRDPIFLSDKFRTDPVGGHEFVYWNREVQVNPSLLKKGRNLFAVALYNDSFSSDAYLDLELAVNKKTLLAFLKYPYLQDLEKTKVTIMWETNIPAVGYVKYGETSFHEREKKGLRDSSKIHEISLKNLKERTTYQYRVYSKIGKEIVSASGIFTTAPEMERPFQFAVYGDTRTNSERHQSVIDAMLKCPKGKPEFVIHSGDLVGSGSKYEQWGTEFFSPAGSLMRNIPLWPCLGNHEGNASWYFKFFSLPNNERWYSFDYSNALFIQLDSNIGYSDFAPGSEQFQWLEKELKSCKKCWKFVSLHHPAFTSGPHGVLGEDGKPKEKPIAYQQEFLVPLFEKYEVDMVFSGHDHFYERSEKITI